MSMTIPVGVVGPSYWGYMAREMSNHLESVVHSKSIQGNVPRGVYYSALEFFKLVVPVVSHQVPENPPASMNAYMIAADVVRNSPGDRGIKRNDLGDRLRGYLDLVKRLDSPGTLNDEEVKRAQGLKCFFSKLAQKGETSAYEEAMGLRTYE